MRPKPAYVGRLATHVTWPQQCDAISQPRVFTHRECARVPSLKTRLRVIDPGRSKRFDMTAQDAGPTGPNPAQADQG